MTTYAETLLKVFTATIIHAKSCGFEVTGKNARMTLKNDTCKLVVLFDNIGDFHTKLRMTNPSFVDMMVISTTLDRLSSMEPLRLTGVVGELHKGLFESALESLG